MSEMDITGMTRENFKVVPLIPETTPLETVNCRSIVLVPSGELHESGFRCFDLVLISTGGHIVGRIATGADAIHIDRIGGFHGGSHYWSMDMLPCGYARLMCSKPIKLPHFICSDIPLEAKR